MTVTVNQCGSYLLAQVERREHAMNPTDPDDQHKLSLFLHRVLRRGWPSHTILAMLEALCQRQLASPMHDDEQGGKSSQAHDPGRARISWYRLLVAVKQEQERRGRGRE